ncbi:hypothetical protein FHT70_002559 [Rhizobium sp. BK049]|uniref:hypothetical protein n=1 Tax=Rhizobium sp. BK049 TaxID=2587095 RepID=UPI0017F29F60|nr:hypothetical protein [Rhizobium sp. BK049]MBB3352626.1 hypothetical protein [Rhizobium sp. BK049]
MIRDEAFAHADFTFDVSETFASLIIEAEGTGSPSKSLAFNVAKQVENGGRPCAATPPNRAAHPDNIRICATCERNFLLAHAQD